MAIWLYMIQVFIFRNILYHPTIMYSIEHAECEKIQIHVAGLNKAIWCHVWLDSFSMLKNWLSACVYGLTFIVELCRKCYLQWGKELGHLGAGKKCLASDMILLFIAASVLNLKYLLITCLREILSYYGAMSFKWGRKSRFGCIWVKLWLCICVSE